MVSRNGQWNNQSVFSDHQFLRVYCASDNLAGHCDRGCIFLFLGIRCDCTISHQGKIPLNVLRIGWTDDLELPGLDIAHCIYPRCIVEHSSTRFVLCQENAQLELTLLSALPWSNRWGLITGVWIRSTTGIPYAVVMIWAANASAGHTKKTTVIALYHIGYGLGNIISPQLFQPRWKVSFQLSPTASAMKLTSDKPRYRPTWIILLVVSLNVCFERKRH